MQDDQVKNAIEFNKLLFEQLKLNREVSDRWFRYYLLFIAAPFAALVTILQIEYVKSSINQLFLFLTFLSILLFIIGLFFELMYLRQRINRIFLIKRIEQIDNVLIKRLVASKNIKILNMDRKIFKFGADFYVSCIYILLNSVWITTAIIFFIAHFKKSLDFNIVEIISCNLIFIITLIFQFSIRSKILSNKN